MKKLRKALSYVLLFCLLLCSCSTAVNAVDGTKEALPLSAGLERLRNEFYYDVADESNGYALDYCYYSPVGNNDTKKYPIVIYLHGIGHGSYKGSQLDDSTMVTWASSELQSKWTNGGAYIILPRCPEDELQYWNKSLAAPLRALIDSFIEKHSENVDTTRIYVGGSSAGGEMAWDLALAYPEYFSGIYPLAATGTRSAEDIRKLKDVAIWVFASKLDPLVNYNTNVVPQWENICTYTAKPAKCRLSSFTTVLNPDGSKGDSNHRLYTTIMYDFFTVDGELYPNVTTVNANGYNVSFKESRGMIYWMDSNHSEFEAPSTENSNPTINSFEALFISVRNIFMRMINIVQRFLGFV